MSNFTLNFNSSDKVETITFIKEDAIFDLANLFKKLLDQEGIEYTVSESNVESPEVED